MLRETIATGVVGLRARAPSAVSSTIEREEAGLGLEPLGFSVCTGDALRLRVSGSDRKGLDTLGGCRGSDFPFACVDVRVEFADSFGRAVFLQFLPICPASPHSKQRAASVERKTR